MLHLDAQKKKKSRNSTEETRWLLFNKVYLVYVQKKYTEHRL